MFVIGPISPASEDFPVWSRKTKYPSPLSYFNGKSPFSGSRWLGISLVPFPPFYGPGRLGL